MDDIAVIEGFDGASEPPERGPVERYRVEIDQRSGKLAEFVLGAISDLELIDAI
jgi:hypothetical protein